MVLLGKIVAILLLFALGIAIGRFITCYFDTRTLFDYEPCERRQEQK